MTSLQPRFVALSTLGLLVCRLTLQAAEQTAPPAPHGPVPSARQLQWHQMEFYGMIHFGLNTFTDQEWGFGDESPALFNPTAFDADQIVGAAKSAGMRGLILVCKHHDGFCLWPSQFTEYSVKASPWREGKGDVVREVSDACRRQGLKFGVYLSPWDRNHKDYGRAEYLVYYRNQLRELLTNYGEVFMAWFDGASGGEGYYGGDRRPRRVDKRSYYGWPETWELVRQLQPHALMFSDAGPDVRWVGNEVGYAPDPCWYTLDVKGRYPGGPTWHDLPEGQRSGADWVPPECDVPLRIGWFYHSKEDTHVKSVTKLLQIYYDSVGRGACLNLNISPDRRGLLHENDVRALAELGAVLDATFATNLAIGAKVAATNVRGGDARFEPQNLLDNHRDSYWATDDGVTSAEVIIDLGRPATFNVVRLREDLPLGQRVEAFALDQWRDGEWREFFQGGSIGSQRLVRTQPVRTDKARLRITKASACPAVSDVGLFPEPPAAIAR